MLHLGDITQLHGDQIPVVDIITGGSPCQDLSVAGKRTGLAGERSGLFMEQIRIVKEMRASDRRTGRTGHLVRPRYMVWENVPGAFSSNKGADFQAVLTEIVKIVEPNAPDVPLPDKGKWPHSGCLYSDMGDWSIAWRVHDAQFWGVPQRRKRIALVADFGGLAAPEILFERKGLSRDIEPCGAERERAAAATESGTGSSNISFQERAGKPGGGKGILIQNEHVGALSTLNNQSVLTYSIGSMNSEGMKSDNPQSGIGETDVARTIDANGGSPAGYQGGIAIVQSSPSVFSIGHDIRSAGLTSNEITDPMTASDYKDPIIIAKTYQDVTGALTPGAHPDSYNGQDAYNDMLIAMASTAAHAEITTDGVSPSLLARAGTGGNNMPNITRDSTVRRLTPLECERLQGYPDGWTDIGEWTDSKGKKHKPADSPRYKALGNSIALPFWQWMARRICAQYERTPTMGSLFDGIGGFPLVFQRSGAVPVWASEIEEFPIAVTKKHFPEEKEDT